MTELNEPLSERYIPKSGEALERYSAMVRCENNERTAKLADDSGTQTVAGVYRCMSAEYDGEAAFQVAGIAKVRCAEPIGARESLVVTLDGRVRKKRAGDKDCSVLGRSITSTSAENDFVKCILVIPREPPKENFIETAKDICGGLKR